MQDQGTSTRSRTSTLTPRDRVLQVLDNHIKYVKSRQGKATGQWVTPFSDRDNAEHYRAELEARHDRELAAAQAMRDLYAEVPYPDPVVIV